MNFPPNLPPMYIVALFPPPIYIAPVSPPQMHTVFPHFLKSVSLQRHAGTDLNSRLRLCTSKDTLVPDQSWAALCHDPVKN